MKIKLLQPMEVIFFINPKCRIHLFKFIRRFFNYYEEDKDHKFPIYVSRTLSSQQSLGESAEKKLIGEAKKKKKLPNLVKQEGSINLLIGYCLHC